MEEPKPQPFCMVKFVGSLVVESMRLSLVMMSNVAALRFEQHPCPCDGCREWSTELDRRGGREV